MLGVMALVFGVAAAGTLELVTGRSAGEPPVATADEIPVRGIAHAPYRERLPAVAPVAGPVNPEFPGITTFRGNLTRSYYGEGPVPRRPRVLWRYPRSGGMCADSTDETGTYTWCGVGWTGQPNVIPHESGRVELRFGAYDTNYHFLDARTGEQMHDSLDTGDLAKGSATSDPDGYPLYYAGSRDNQFRVVALDRGRVPEVLWSLDSNTSAPEQVWNDDWDAAALVVGDYLLAGGENSWLHVIKLNRGWTSDGKVRVRPRVVLTLPSWDDQLSVDAPDRHYSIESSPAFHDGVVYFANSAGLVQGWDISRVLRGGRRGSAGLPLLDGRRHGRLDGARRRGLPVRGERAGEDERALGGGRAADEAESAAAAAPAGVVGAAAGDRREGRGRVMVDAGDRPLDRVRGDERGRRAGRGSGFGPRALADPAARADLELAGGGRRRADPGRLRGRPARV